MTAMVRRHTTTFIMIYIAFLPLGIWPTLGWVTVVVAPLFAMLLVRVAANHRSMLHAVASKEQISSAHDEFKLCAGPVCSTDPCLCAATRLQSEEIVTCQRLEC